MTDSPPSEHLTVQAVTIANGTGTFTPISPSPPLGPTVPRRYQWFDLPEEQYPELRIKLWVNYPSSINKTLTTRDQDEQRAALCKIVLEHNGWRKVDDDGTDAGPYPPANTPEFWDEIPDELAAVILTLLLVEIPKLAALLRETRGR